MACSSVNRNNHKDNIVDDSDLEKEEEEIPTTIIHNSVPIEIEPEKTLNINPNLTPVKNDKLLQVLKRQKEAFTWENKYMKGIHPNLCTHHIYIKKDCIPI